MNEITIKKVTIKDVAILQELARRIFFDSFANDNSAKNMEEYMDKAFSIQQLTLELNNPDSVFYFAEHQEIPIGYLKLNYGSAQTELQSQNALEIERIYISKEYQGKRIGQRLCDKAITMAKEKGLDYVWLGVWQKNHKSIRFYEKYGFEKFGRHIFLLGKDKQTDIMMKLEL